MFLHIRHYALHQWCCFSIRPHLTQSRSAKDKKEFNTHNKNTAHTARIELLMQVRQAFSNTCTSVGILHIKPLCKAGPEGPCLQCQRERKQDYVLKIHHRKNTQLLWSQVSHRKTSSLLPRAEAPGVFCVSTPLLWSWESLASTG